MNNTFTENETASFSSDAEGNTHERTAIIVTSVLDAFLLLIAVIGNLLVISSLLKTPSLRSPSTTLLCCLAASDLLVGVVVPPLFVTFNLTEDLVVGNILRTVCFGSCGVSLWTLTDRFLAPHYHMRYAVMVTSHRIVWLMLETWLLIFLSFGIYFWNRLLYVVIASIFIVLCLLTALFSYVRVFMIVRRHQLQIDAQLQAVESSNTSTDNLDMMHIKRSTINTFIFFIFLILCYLPMLILLILYGTYDKELYEMFLYFSTIVFMNSLLNPILYCWRMRDLQKAVLKTARRMLCLQIDQD